MDWDFYVAIGSLSVALGLSLWLTVCNYRNLVATKPERLAARRRERARRKSKWRWPI
jgi:hypothetical protein